MELLASLIAHWLIYTLLIISLNNFIISKTSIWSIGHIAFFGLGSFLVGLMIADYGIPHFIALFLTILLGFLVCVVIGLTLKRLKGDYFIILSIAIIEIVRGVSNEMKGPSGISEISRPSLVCIPLDNDWLYILLILLPFFGFVLWLNWRVRKSPIERISHLIQQNESAAELLKISPSYYKIGFFCMGSIQAMIVGGFYTIYIGGTDPKTVTIYQGILIFAMVLLGGINSIRGSILGGIMLVVVPKLIERIINTPEASFYAYHLLYLIYGIFLVIAIKFFPKGLMEPSSNSLSSIEE